MTSIYLAVAQDEARSSAARAPATALKTPNVKSQRDSLYKTSCQTTARMPRISFQPLGERHTISRRSPHQLRMNRSLSTTCCAGGKPGPDLASLVDQAGLSGKIPADVVKDVRKIWYGLRIVSSPNSHSLCLLHVSGGITDGTLQEVS